MRSNANRQSRLKLIAESEPPVEAAAALERPPEPIAAAPAAPRAETVSERVRRLQAEARALAGGQIAALAEQMRSVAALAEEIAEGGDAYPVGAREIARRLTDEMAQKAQTLRVILDKA